ARRMDRLQEVASVIQKDGGSVVIHQLDVTELEQMQAIIDEAQSHFGRVDAVINNAGVMPLSSLEALKIEEWNRMIDVNSRDVVRGSAAVLPVMRTQALGHLITIAAIGAYEVTATAAVYCATKSAVRAMTDGLRQETVAQGIRVTLVSPVQTEPELDESM